MAIACHMSKMLIFPSFPLSLIISTKGAVAQLGERRVRNAKVGSSILLGSTNYNPWICIHGIIQ